jgi:hypothetical protein
MDELGLADGHTEVVEFGSVLGHWDLENHICRIQLVGEIALDLNLQVRLASNKKSQFVCQFPVVSFLLR